MTDRSIPGTALHPDVPNWDALEGLLQSDELCAHFMWMYDVLIEDGTELSVYKHRWTRAYMHLAMDGAGYMYTGDGRYKRIPTPGLLAAVFAKWDCCKPTPSERRALAVALKRAGE